MNGKSKLRCPYNECKLPKDNNRYCVQFCILIISLSMMLINTNSFNFLAIFMFTVPIVLDLFYTDVNGKIIRFLRTIFLIYNIAISLFCLLGQFGFLIDQGDCFSVVESAVVFSGITIKKSSLVFPLSVDLMFPIVMFFGCPNRTSGAAIKFIENRKGA